MTHDQFQSKLMSMQAPLLEFAKMLTANRDDAYDLLQDTTLKAIDNRDKYADNTNFKGWVYTIMRNIFINNYRRSSRTTSISDMPDNLQQKPESHNAYADVPEGAFTVREITDAINRFPTEYRVPFSMHVAGYKYSEISDRTSIPLGTVKSRIFAARKKLQEMFADYNN